MDSISLILLERFNFKKSKADKNLWRKLSSDAKYVFNIWLNDEEVIFWVVSMHVSDYYYNELFGYKPTKKNYSVIEFNILHKDLFKFLSHFFPNIGRNIKIKKIEKKNI